MYISFFLSCIPIKKYGVVSLGMGFDRLTACSWCGAKWVKVTVIDLLLNSSEKWENKRSAITHPVAISHILMVLSREAETMKSPLGMKVTLDTLWSWPAHTTVHTCNVCVHYHVQPPTMYIYFLASYSINSLSLSLSHSHTHTHSNMHWMCTLPCTATHQV